MIQKLSFKCNHLEFSHISVRYTAWYETLEKAVTTNVTVFWDMMPRSLVEVTKLPLPLGWIN
jgi:hypothetical protein